MWVNPIRWAMTTINPFVGCTYNCSFGCYARRQAKRQKQNCINCYNFTPHLHLKRLNALTPRQKPRRIFIGSMGDIADIVYGNMGDVHDYYDIDANPINAMNHKFKECSQHTFLILTKRPMWLRGIKFPDNVWIGTSINRYRDIQRGGELDYSHCSPKGNYFVSFEPLLECVRYKEYYPPDFFKWIIIGGLSRPGKEPKSPPSGAILDILEVRKRNDIPVFMKDNIGLPEEEMIREFPEGMPVYPNEEV